MKFRWLISAGLFVTALGFVTQSGLGQPAVNRAAGRLEGLAAIEVKHCQVQLIKNVTLAAARPGILSNVKPSEGDFVKAGEVLVQLRDEVARALLKKTEKEAENDIEERFAIASADVAEAEYEKSLEANQKSPAAVPNIEVRRLKLALERSRLQIEQAQRQMVISGLDRDQAAAELESYKIEAPFDGFVTRVHKSAGEAVQQGEDILEIINTERVRVEGTLSIQQLLRIKRGDLVLVEVDRNLLNGNQQTFEGRVVFVDLTVSPADFTGRVWAEVVNPNNLLRAGLRARMKIHPNTSKKPANR